MYIPIIFFDVFTGIGEIFIGIILLAAFIIYIYVSHEKFSCFYKDNKRLIRKNIMNCIFLFMGMTILYIVKMFLHKSNLVELSFRDEIFIMITGILFCAFSMNDSQQILNKFTDKD